MTTQVNETDSNVASRRIATLLKEQILNGELLPGDRIFQEAIAERFGASRLPVREALRILASDGLVTLVANTGAWVARMSEQQCAETYKIRERLEPLLLRESMAALGAEDVERLACLATRMEETPDVEAFLKLDREFHLLSYSASETFLLSDIVNRLWDTTQHYRRLFTRLVNTGRNRATHYEHHLLVDALVRSDADDAEKVLASHIRRTRLELSRHPEAFQ